MTAMTIKVHAGDWGETVAGFGPGWTNRYRIAFSRGFLKGHDQYIVDQDIRSIEVLTEDNKISIAGKLGWGVAGGALLGPVGLLAGLFMGGKRKDVTFHCEFMDGKRVLATTDAATFNVIRLGVAKREMSAERTTGTLMPDPDNAATEALVRRLESGVNNAANT